ncbi:leucine-rich repeat-containing protein 72 isoform X4 [Hypanus sabinus]|uniref:leucine-rich repeat-containing protein 72 isoform X4 n=1 Tax=Hypanus sabinus TaxID=79690 RepID=UPI0028C466EB|nr:leucine-rich repeat-containing protein 72 isoform X4 [Hypanus sabinus]XP_059828634.1 leucine-rich repeat-containing protein 72 isoform X4 [Hypanus sabinus]
MKYSHYLAFFIDAPVCQDHILGDINTQVLGNQLKLYKIRKNSDVIELYLAKKRLTEVPDLSRFKQLKYLWLNHNKIKKISSLTMNYCLKELYLQNNLLTDVTDTLKHLTNLEILMLHNNWLTKLEKVVTELKKLMWLHTLNLFNNPLTQDQDYRLYVIYHLPSVQLLDRKYILQRERDVAFSFCNQDRMRIRQSLAFGQRIHTQLHKQTAPKKNNYTYPGSMIPVPHQKGILKKMKKKISETSKEEAVERVRKISEMKFSTFNWNKLPNAQQKHLGDENVQIIATKFR